MITIHSAAKQDAHIIGKFIHHLLVELQHSSPNLDEAFYTAKAEELLADSPPQMYAFIAKDSAHRPIGLITVGSSAAIYAEGVFGIIHELYVVPEARSANVGRLLLNEAQKLASQKHWTRLEVTAPDEEVNPRTIGFYLRERFERVGPHLKFQIDIS